MTSAGYGLPSFLRTLGNGWVEVAASSGGDEHWIQSEGGMQANGFLYWVYEDRRYLVSLDTTTMEFRVTELPHCLRQGMMMVLGNGCWTSPGWPPVLVNIGNAS
ncbi:hypothetical protein BAE44_0001698 [Dichanthelium oligosanthes]|uniref:F-box associated domain-containing protein n=1 Tax=Dichanthelium oligosanthes TaxID=888268 RepID=A0A1E5WIS8_9POAL|nr:hypothetical protein BAE44_0001698 [Dichanthelium oligosanthes]